MILLLLWSILSCHGFYLPGVAPRNFADGEPIDIKVNKLESVKTQLPYSYYSLPFCQPAKIEEKAENLGEILAGEVIETSAYQASMKLVQACVILCRANYVDSELKQFATKIEEDYRVNWIVDNMPAATKYYTEDVDGDQMILTPHYEKGFPLGFVGSVDIPGTTPGVAYVNNHVRLSIFYHEEPGAYEGFRIVGFEVSAFSVQHQLDGPWREDKTRLSTCTYLDPVTRAASPQPVSGVLSAADKSIIWTYDVQWEASDVKWASRWDLYLKMADPQIHWFSIVNSILIVLFLSGMVVMILTRTLRADLQKYNKVIDLTEDEEEEESGWKIIHGEVFRVPAYPAALAVLVGTGVQVFMMSLVVLVFAVLGFLSPSNRGSLMTATLLLFVFMGSFAGYHSQRLHKMFGLTDWKRNTAVTALLFPGVVFGVFFLLNLLVWGQKSSGAVPFGSLLSLLVLWLGVSCPLVYVGSFLAYKQPAVEFPVRVNLMPRVVMPPTQWYANPVLATLVGGVLPFGAVFIEIYFIMSSVWLHQFYYAFGFLALVVLILIITCAEISIVMCYFQLCNEDYHWWWRSFLTSGSSALYLLLYSVLYFCTKLQINTFVSGALFFGYMFLVSAAFFVLTGSIGYFACYHFVRKIYSSIKID